MYVYMSFVLEFLVNYSSSGCVSLCFQLRNCLQRSKLAQIVALLNCIENVPLSNLYQNTGCPKALHVLTLILLTWSIG
jgi:hypothetical protein